MSCLTYFKDYLLHKICPKLLNFTNKYVPPPVLSISINATSTYSVAQARKLNVIFSKVPTALPIPFSNSVYSFSEIDINSAHVSFTFISTTKGQLIMIYPLT